MADLISREALLKECAEHQKTDPRFEGRGWASHFINDAGEPSTEWYCVEDMIENAPAVDAVPVVRCRDCKYCYGIDNDPMTPYDGETDWYCEEFDVDWHVLTLDPNRFYCANGERRDDDGKDA